MNEWTNNKKTRLCAKSGEKNISKFGKAFNIPSKNGCTRNALASILLKSFQDKRGDSLSRLIPFKVDILFEDPSVQNNALILWIQGSRNSEELNRSIVDSVDLAEHAEIRRKHWSARAFELARPMARSRSGSNGWETIGSDAGRRAEKGVGSRAEDQEKKEEEQSAPRRSS